MIFKSLQHLTRTFNTSSLTLAFCKIGNFSNLDDWLAIIISSNKAKVVFSTLCPRVYLSFLGKSKIVK